MTFYQLRISIIPILLLSTGAGIVTWQVQAGLDRRRNRQMVTLVRAYDEGHLSDDVLAAKLRAVCSEKDLLAWLDFPTHEVRRTAVRALGLIGTVRCVPALTRVLEHGNDDRMRRLAEPAIRQARRRTGDPKVDDLLNLAEEYASAARTLDALRVLEQCTVLMPESAEVYYLYGTILFDSEDLEAAEAAFSKALELAPDHFDAWLGRGLCNMGLARDRKTPPRPARERARQARADCLRALEINPNMVEVRLLLEGFQRAGLIRQRQTLPRGRKRDPP